MSMETYPTYAVAEELRYYPEVTPASLSAVDPVRGVQEAQRRSNLTHFTMIKAVEAPQAVEAGHEEATAVKLGQLAIHQAEGTLFQLFYATGLRANSTVPQFAIAAVQRSELALAA